MAQISIETEREFGILLRSLNDDRVTAAIHWKLCNDLWSSKSEFPQEMAQSWTFWSQTIRAHHDAALFRLCRIYDSHRTALSLRNLLDTVRANLPFFSAESFRERRRDSPYVSSLAAEPRVPTTAQLDSDLASVVEGDPLVRRLVLLRHKALSHRQPSTVLDPSELEHLSNEDIDALIKRAGTILNRYQHLFEASIDSDRIIGHDDYKSLLKAVRERLVAHERELAEEMERLSRR